MKTKKNGVTIEIGISVTSNSGSLTITHNGISDKVSFGVNAAIALKQFLSDPEPAEDTRDFHLETFKHVEDERNKRWFCKVCKTQYIEDISGVFICRICNSEMTNIFNYENRIYEDD